MSLHASLVLRRDDAHKLVKLFNYTGNFPDTAEAFDLILRASTQSTVAIVTTTNRIHQMTEWLKQYQVDKKLKISMRKDRVYLESLE